MTHAWQLFPAEAISNEKMEGCQLKSLVALGGGGNPSFLKGLCIAACAIETELSLTGLCSWRHLPKNIHIPHAHNAVTHSNPLTPSFFLYS